MRQISIPFITVCILTSLGLADVNMKDGSFLYRDKDAFIHRTYSSRSMNSGWLGYGWCTNLEKRLRIQQDRITLLDCSLDREVSFLKPKPSTPARSGEFLLRQIGRHYILTKISRSPALKALFNSDGQLIELTENGQRPLHLNYSLSGRVTEVIDHSQNRTWLLTWGKAEKIIELSSKSEDSIVYSYSNDNLTQVSSNLGLRTSLRYSYDSFHNLESIQRNGKNENRLTYDTDHDRLLSQQKSEACLEIYKYSSTNDLHFSSSAERHCGKARPQIRTYEFWQKTLSEGFHLLTKMKLTAEGQTRHYRYDALSDKFIEIHPSIKLGVLND